MKASIAMVAVAVLRLAADPLAAQEATVEQMARKVIDNAGVKPGEVVAIAGGKHTVPLLEALAIEAQKAGALSQIFLSSDRVVRASFMEVPEQYMGQRPAHLAEWLKHIDVWIGLPNVEDPKTTFAAIPAERFAKNVQAGRVVTDMLDASGVRAVFIGYPTKEVAALNQVDFGTFEKMHWEALNADARTMSDTGNALKSALQAAKTVRVTSPSGTDFTFSVTGRHVFVDDGRLGAEKARAALIVTRTASLPGGTVFVAPVENSAHGKVVVPRTRCRNEPLTGVSFQFVNGKLQDFKADRGADCFASVLAPYSGPRDMFGSFTIGINPARTVLENPGDYRPVEAAGMVLIGIGDNKLAGGNNKAPGGFSFPIVNATVEIGGKVFVKDGQLVR